MSDNVPGCSINLGITAASLPILKSVQVVQYARDPIMNSFPRSYPLVNEPRTGSHGTIRLNDREAVSIKIQNPSLLDAVRSENQK